MDTISKKRWDELRSLAKKGDANSRYEVGYYYENGGKDESNIVVKIDPLKALHWYRLAAEQGEMSAQGALCVLLSSGDKVALDFESAICWAKKAIAQGDASAAHNLGTIYRDLNRQTMAFRCYVRAVAMGDNDSLLNIGLCHLFGIGTKKNINEANKCLNTIISGESTATCQRTKENARYWMAVLNLLDLGCTKKSVKRARCLLESSNVDDDHEQANEILNIIGKNRS
jgi:tetratricopeptide (TPR) repeat protein